MPKKTRKKKILAQQRKVSLNITSINKPIRENITSQNSPEVHKISTPSKADTLSQMYFVEDLKKSLRLIGIIIALEIMIYFGTMNNYLSLIFKFK